MKTEEKKNRLCSVANCGRAHSAKGYCGKHYRKWKVYGNPLAGQDKSYRWRNQLTSATTFGYWKFIKIVSPVLAEFLCTGCNTVHTCFYQNIVRNGSRSCGCKQGEFMATTSLERYGCHTPTLLPEVQARMKDSNIRNHGVAHPMQSEKLKQKARATFAANGFARSPEEQAERHRQYLRDRRKNDVQFKLSINLRVRLHAALEGRIRSASAVRDLGCTIEQLKEYLTQKFYPHPETQEMMSWANHGHQGWHIDHIMPLALFDLTNTEQLKFAIHYTNLQPLWNVDHLQKSNYDRAIIRELDAEDYWPNREAFRSDLS